MCNVRNDHRAYHHMLQCKVIHFGFWMIKACCFDIARISTVKMCDFADGFTLQAVPLLLFGKRTVPKCLTPSCLTHFSPLTYLE